MELEAPALRVHGRLSLKSDGKLRSWTASPFMFCDRFPHKTEDAMTRSTHSCSGWAGCYYVTAWTELQIASSTNTPPLKSFLVSPERIFNVVQAGKMEYAKAKVDLT